MSHHLPMGEKYRKRLFIAVLMRIVRGPVTFCHSGKKFETDTRQADKAASAQPIPQPDPLANSA